MRLAVFDLDGTILDTLEDLHDALNRVLADHGFPLRQLSETRQFVGNGIKKLIVRAAPPETAEGKIDEMFQAFLLYYREHCAEKTRPYPGIPKMLRALKDAGFKLSVVSNKEDRAVKILCEAYFPGIFDVTAGETEGIRRKPAPDLVNRVLTHLRVKKEEAVYIGDSDVDIETAKNAGIACISVDWGFRGAGFLKEHGAERIVYSPEELEERLIGQIQ